MGNPELRRGSHDDAWVRYLQGLLGTRLATEAAAGLTLSAVDGDFGPLTEESVKVFQRSRGLADDGVVGDATWDALENSTAPAAPPAATGGPLALTVPFEFRLHWPETTLDRMLQDFDSFDLATHPGARLTLGGGQATRLAGNGGVQLFNREVPLWRNWFLTEATRVTLDWSRAGGVDLGLDNEAELRWRPLRGVELFLHGDLDLNWQPEVGEGAVKWGVIGGFRLTIDVLGGASR